MGKQAGTVSRGNFRPSAAARELARWADVLQRAVGAIGPLGEADAASVEDHAEAEVAPLGCREVAVELQLDLHRILLGGQPEAP